MTYGIKNMYVSFKDIPKEVPRVTSILCCDNVNFALDFASEDSFVQVGTENVYDSLPLETKVALLGEMLEEVALRFPMRSLEQRAKALIKGN